jgi:hypothetical protein
MFLECHSGCALLIAAHVHLPDFVLSTIAVYTLYIPVYHTTKIVPNELRAEQHQIH